MSSPLTVGGRVADAVLSHADRQINKTIITYRNFLSLPSRGDVLALHLQSPLYGTAVKALSRPQVFQLHV